MHYHLARVFICSAALAAALSLGCHNDKVTPIERETDTAAVDTPDGGGSASDVDFGLATCRQFVNFASDCGASEAFLEGARGYCESFDAVFIDSFTIALMTCMADPNNLTCEHLLALVAAADAGAGSADGGAAADTSAASPVVVCYGIAMLTAQPEQANLNFRQHFCDWAMQCDSTLTLAECEVGFIATGVSGGLTSALPVFMFVDEPYISQADACVTPMPRCGDSTVTDCLQAVGEDLGVALGF